MITRPKCTQISAPRDGVNGKKSPARRCIPADTGLRRNSIIFVGRGFSHDIVLKNSLRLHSLRKKSKCLPSPAARYGRVQPSQHRQDCLCHQSRAAADFFRKL